MSWNRSGGNGEGTFANQRGGGAGAFNWEVWNSANQLERTPMTLDAQGKLTTIGDHYLNWATPRIHLGLAANKVIFGIVLSDAAGDFHIWCAAKSQLIMGFYRASNLIKLGNNSTQLQIGDRRVLTLPVVTRTGENLLDLGGRI